MTSLWSDRQVCYFRDDPAEVSVRRTCNPLDLIRFESGECGLDLSLHHAAPDTERPVREPAQGISESAHRVKRKLGKCGHEHPQSEHLDAVRELHRQSRSTPRTARSANAAVSRATRSQLK